MGKSKLVQADPEKAVLGAMLINDEIVPDIIDVLGESGNAFRESAHADIYKAIVDLCLFEPLDHVVLMEKLNYEREDGHWGKFLGELIGSVPTSLNGPHYAKIVRDRHSLRLLGVECQKMVKAAQKESCGDIREIMENFEADVFKITKTNISSVAVSVGDLVDKGIKLIQNMNAGKKEGILTGFDNIDHYLRRLEPGNVVVVAARPGIGKTAFALNLAKNISKRLGVAYYSAEMSDHELIKRIIHSESNLSNERMCQTTPIELNETLQEARFRIQDLNLWIDDNADLTPVSLRMRVKRLIAKHDISLIIVDYLQLMHDPERRRDGRQNEIASISRQMKLLAKECNVPVVVLSQLSRAGEELPKLTHLRDSGAIEQDADIVLLLHDGDTYGELICDIAKHRNGPTGLCKMRFEKNLQRITSLGQLDREKNYGEI